MKKNVIISFTLILFSFLLWGCTKNDQQLDNNNMNNSSKDTADENKQWQTDYAVFLNDLYQKNRSTDNRMGFCTRDLDNNGIPELIISKNGVDLTIYTYEHELVRAGRHDFKSGTTQFLVSDNASYPGIFIFSVGGGYEWYEYLKIAHNKLQLEDLWNKDFSGISKVLGKKRKKIKEISTDKQLIKESRIAYKRENKLHFKKLHPDNLKSIEGM